jgi:UDP-N-acetylglucosamine transferase subunit ALG13
VIFATVGTHHQPFERMLASIECFPGRACVVVQYGYGRPPAGVARAAAFMSFDEIEECLCAAEAVITHAGVGTILCALRAGHRPIVIPRLHSLGEHVDDHQVELTRVLAEHGQVEPIWQGGEIKDALARVPPRSAEPIVSQWGDTFAAAVRRALLDAG